MPMEAEKGPSGLSPALILKAAVTVLLVGLILGRVDWTLLGDRFLDLRLDSLGLALISFLAIAVLEVLRLRIAFGVLDLGWPALVRLYVVGLFFGAFLPGQVGADLYRYHVLGRGDGDRVRPLALLILLRSLGFVTLVGGAVVALALHGPGLRDALVSTVDFSVHWGIVVVFLGFGCLVLGAFGISSRLRSRLGRLGRRSGEALDSLGRRGLGSLIVLSVLILGARLMMVFFLAAATGSSIDGAGALLVSSLAMLVTVLPISIAGIGLREAATITLLVFLGVPYESAVVVALLGRVFMLVLAAVGGVSLMMSRTR